MKIVKISIQDENTLVLQEDASKGDLIDLKSIHEIDIDKGTIENVVSSIKKDKFREELEKAVKAKDQEYELKLQLEAKAIAEKANVTLGDKDALITRLQGIVDSSEIAKELAVTKAVGSVEKERDELKVKLSSEELDKKRIESSLTEKYETQIKDRNDTIERLKDMKAKLSIKLLGENLEQHCQNEFNNVRSGMFPFAYFEKDNEAVEGTKGDYVYRDYESKDGIEIISIMFEMKDEQDTSVNKKTVESHLRKLDEDRRKKKCEYAVLVTLLEADNELYNRGIVDVSYKYNKMFVVRPQFFLPLISLLKNAGLKSAEDKRQLLLAKNSNIDIENFVDNVETWKTSWSGNMKNAAKKHSEAIDQIEKAIKDLEKVRDALTMSDKHLLTAENKMDDLTVKRLTKNAPSVAERFRELG
ncbi:MAG TPA: DUF2130 domain-containing protein [Candidatus Chromulinivoraceae bacterium]|nr:DUF2130 domain-containing protein [Candidatus Chromulinivoraceae bacterium]